MRPRFLVTAALIAAALFTGAALTHAQTASTDPVGFVTLSIPGTGGVATNAISFKSLGLVQPVVYQGSAETVNITNKTLTDDGATWTDDQFNGAQGAFYVEIVRPAGQSTAAPGEGTTYDIAATSRSTKTITVAQPLDSTIIDGANFKVRKHWTIGSLFGATNTAGFQGSNSASTADQILIWNGSSYDLYFYQIDPSQAQNLGGTGWRTSLDAYSNAATSVVYPDDGLIFKTLQSNPINVVIMGAVKTGSSLFPVSTGFNIFANIYAAPLTLADSGLRASGLAGAASASDADQVLLWNGAGYDTYFYQIDPSQAQNLGGTGWRSGIDAYSDAGNTSIAVGAAIIVKRVQTTSFNWVIPQHPATL